VHAVVVREFGGPDRLLLEERPHPRPGPGEVELAVAVAGVNRADLLARAGRYHRGGRPPLVLGLEGAGTVVTLGEGVEGLVVGQQVVASGAINEPGFYAEFVAVPANHVVPIPDGVDLLAAAALPTAWLSAWYCLRRLADVQPGEWVVVHAAASGVGSAAVQIAVDAGARVIATAGSAAKTQWARQLGAAHAFDRSVSDRQQIIEGIVRLSGGGVDVVLDTVGGQTFADSLHTLAYGGRLVALANVALEHSTIDTRDFYPRNVRILGFQISSLMEHGYDPRADLAELLHAIATERFIVPIDMTFPLARAVDAHAYLERRANRGKVLLTVDALPQQRS
jgi:NADPH2:quinone reductase